MTRMNVRLPRHQNAESTPDEVCREGGRGRGVLEKRLNPQSSSDFTTIGAVTEVSSSLLSEEIVVGDFDLNG